MFPHCIIKSLHINDDIHPEAPSITDMALGAEIVARIFELRGVRNKVARRMIGAVSLFIAVTMPITFRYNFLLYIHRETAVVTKYITGSLTL